MYTGGRLRAMDSLYSEAAPAPLPATDSAAYHVLDQLTRLQQHKTFDAFNPEAVAPETIDQWLAEWHAARHAHNQQADFVDLHALLDADVVAEHPSQRGKYTFATPVDYFRMLRQKPHVFVSHAAGDGKTPYFTQFVAYLRSCGAVVTVCEDSAAQRAMAEDGITRWEALQVGEKTLNSCIVLALSSAFMARLADATSRVSREVRLASAHARDGTRTTVIMVSLEKMELAWLNHPSLEHLKHKLVHVLPEQLQLAAWQACNMHALGRPFAGVPAS